MNPLPTLILGIALLVAGFGSGWQVQNWRYGAKEKDRVEDTLKQTREIAGHYAERAGAVIAAQNAAKVRESSLRSDADLARAELGSLREQSDAALLAGRSSIEACLVTANAFSVVFHQCAKEYQGLGAIADRHASDAQTLTDAWPSK